MTRARSSGIVIVLACMLMLPVFAQVTPTLYAMNFYGNATLNGEPIPVDAVVTAYDPDGVLCGEFPVTTAGQYGLMPVYGNDSGTTVDEGAVAGDTISFRINGYAATVVSGTTTWVNMGQQEVVLSVVLPSPPVVTSATASPGTIVANGTDTTVLNVTATDPDGNVASVIVDLSAIGGSATQVLTPIGADTWQCTTVARFVGSFNLPVNVTDNDGNSNTSVSISLTTEEPGVAATLYAMNFYGNATLDGESIPVGAVITAYDPDGVLCGVWTVTTAGQYGLMPVYGNDSGTTVDEGAVAGDTISFRICGYDATVVSGTTTWANMGQQEVVLSAVATPPGALATITISGTDTIYLNDPTRTFSAICKDANDIVISPCPTLTWHSSNTAVGGITPGGVFTASVAGTTTITASAEGITSNGVVVTVNAQPGNESVTGGRGNATSGGSFVDVTLSNMTVNGTVTTQQIGDPVNDPLSSAGGNYTNLNLGTGAGQNQLIAGAVVNVSQSVRDALLADVNGTSWVYIRLNYNQSVVDSLGIREESIEIWKYNETTHGWEKVIDQPYCITGDRNMDDNYVWVNVTELSTFALVGPTTTTTTTTAPSGGGTYPPGWFATPTVTATAAPIATPTVTPPEEAVTTPTKPVVEKTPAVIAEETPTKKKPWIPGFTAVFAIAGLLAVAYAMMRRRD